MRLKLVMTGAILVLAALAMAQTMDEQAVEVTDNADPKAVAGLAELKGLAPPPLQLGADLGNACICLCRQADSPRERWGYYERSIVSGCKWSNRVCVVDGALGTLGACTDSPAPLVGR